MISSKNNLYLPNIDGRLSALNNGYKKNVSGMGLIVQDGGSDHINMLFGKNSPGGADRQYFFQSVSSIGGIQQSMINLDAKDLDHSVKSPQNVGAFPEKDHVLMNKEKTRVQSILNTKKSNA